MSAQYQTAARNLLAKMISELAWEEVLSPAQGELRLQSGAIWRFQSRRGIWAAPRPPHGCAG